MRNHHIWTSFKFFKWVFNPYYLTKIIHGEKWYIKDIYRKFIFPLYIIVNTYMDFFTPSCEDNLLQKICLKFHFRTWIYCLYKTWIDMSTHPKYGHILPLK